MSIHCPDCGLDYEPEEAPPDVGTGVGHLCSVFCFSFPTYYWRSEGEPALSLEGMDALFVKEEAKRLVADLRRMLEGRAVQREAIKEAFVGQADLLRTFGR